MTNVNKQEHVQTSMCVFFDTAKKGTVKSLSYVKRPPKKVTVQKGKPGCQRAYGQKKKEDKKVTVKLRSPPLRGARSKQSTYKK